MRVDVRQVAEFIDDVSLAAEAARGPNQKIDRLTAIYEKVRDGTIVKIEDLLAELENYLKAEWSAVPMRIFTSEMRIEKQGEVLRDIHSVQDAGFNLLGGLPDLPDDMETRTIPINVDSFPEITRQNEDMVMNLLHIVALKQLYLNRRYGHDRIRFEFVSVSGERERLRSELESRYRDISALARNRSNRAGEAQPALPGFLITDVKSLPHDYRETRVVALERRIELDNNSHLWHWNGVLDVAIAETVLLGQGEDTKMRSYEGLKRLYKLLGRDLTQPQFITLLAEDVRKAIAIAKELALPPCERFNLDELKAFYERMKDALIAA
jgi:hypothetical protein